MIVQASHVYIHDTKWWLEYMIIVQRLPTHVGSFGGMTFIENLADSWLENVLPILPSIDYD